MPTAGPPSDLASPTIADDVADTDADADEPRHQSLAIGLGIAAFLLMALFWAAIFTGKFNSRNPDLLHDTSWAVQAEKTCNPAATFISDLPNASTTKTAAERATLLDKGTVALEPMVAELGRSTPNDAVDKKIVAEWLTDWKTYLNDRREFAAALRKDAKAMPLLTKTHGGWDTDAIDAMAAANNAPSCATPQDM